MNASGASTMLGRAGTRAILERVLRLSTAEATEAILVDSRNALTRFADNYVHQNHLDRTPTLTVRAVFGSRAGIASTTRLDEAGLAAVTEQAAAIARRAPENPEFPGLAGAGSEISEAAYSAETMDAAPERRVALAGIACRLAREAGLAASGSVNTVGEEIAVANSQGVFAYTPRSRAGMTIVATGTDGSGYADELSLNLATIDAEAVATRAVETGLRAQRPREVAPGDYTVILQPAAVSDMLSFLSMLGFNGRAVQEGRSFMAGKEGRQVLGENITIRDDGMEPDGLPLPFDYEGEFRRPLSLIEGGVAREIALDRYFGRLLDRPSNGHAMPPGSASSPLPVNMLMAPGESSVEEMIRSTDRGLLITHFHYTRVVHPLHVIVTGMTRDGTFLIERGEVMGPVKNLRYTQSYLEALRDVQAISRDTQLTGGMIVSRVPALKIGRFTFTGVTQ